MAVENDRVSPYARASTTDEDNELRLAEIGSSRLIEGTQGQFRKKARMQTRPPFWETIGHAD
jgi:hypothetical protein